MFESCCRQFWFLHVISELYVVEFMIITQTKKKTQ